MNYSGKIYGRVAGKYFDTGNTTDDWDAMVKSLEVHDQNEHPKPSEDDPSFSVDVICADQEGMMNIGSYSFTDEKWIFHTDTLVDPYEFGEVYPFVWMYRPKELEVK